MIRPYQILVWDGVYTVQVSANRNNATAQHNLMLVRRDFSNSDIVLLDRTNRELYHVIIRGVMGWELTEAALRLGNSGFAEIYVRRES